MIDLETLTFLQSAEGEIHFKKLKQNNDFIAFARTSSGMPSTKATTSFGPQQTFKLSGSPQIGPQQGHVP